MNKRIMEARQKLPGLDAFGNTQYDEPVPFGALAENIEVKKRTIQDGEIVISNNETDSLEDEISRLDNRIKSEATAIQTEISNNINTKIQTIEDIIGEEILEGEDSIADLLDNLEQIDSNNQSAIINKIGTELYNDDTKTVQSEIARLDTSIGDVEDSVDSLETVITTQQQSITNIQNSITSLESSVASDIDAERQARITADNNIRALLPIVSDTEPTTVAEGLIWFKIEEA